MKTIVLANIIIVLMAVWYFLENKTPINKVKTQIKTGKALDEDEYKVKTIGLEDYKLQDIVEVLRINNEFILHIKEKIYFEPGTINVVKMPQEVLDQILKFLIERKWFLTVEGHAETGESNDTYLLSAQRADAVTKVFIKNGLNPKYINSIFYGDSRPRAGEASYRVEFLVHKLDLREDGIKL